MTPISGRCATFPERSAPAKGKVWTGSGADEDKGRLRFAALQLGADPDVIRDYAELRQTVSEHQQEIREYLSLRPFDDSAAADLARFLEGEAPRLDRTRSLLARARGYATGTSWRRGSPCCCVPSGRPGRRRGSPWPRASGSVLRRHCASASMRCSIPQPMIGSRP